ncbi:TonB-dependent receptor [Bradyrhizobium sp. U87765 SZCCT0131]|uniref:TonB-dependent receptor n=1 Tax=unclassified Bradyrhizobium TaxID=2631580 RepID=UPI001BA6F9E1|nr:MULTISPECIES: TonB-dependent receptor [unclassified Bradyrhizobium]MBR1220025.1 TonB-dependent receptor [Bradyrhizobium sp. U87765 SZCCT0131]MBR1263519.1 TonB-dependent receptor [Bradyrhizobium sp. U87765 SZCCT0134]MBR1309088.1 TonB-dependent receptor [Bradyrhizobium sp. U87765 SZCCT0110]MBR1323851.1 TonB-dependent receptor [Bradyrhizobium sp. U87765 SZCCT0109]MBR1349403.1 TonB-dependent receptor [Bradyrhizobium sp. U87765 SZCCT0048]
MSSASHLARLWLALPVTLTLAPSVSAQTAADPLPPVVVETARQRPKPAPRVKRRVASSTPRVQQARPTAAVPAGQVANADTQGAGGRYPGTPPAVSRYQLPQQSFSTTAKQIEETVNLKDPEDAIKYMPSLFVRKRNDGDNQAVLATRTWGLNSSARSLIYADDVLISALIANNNTSGSPHWNLVSPDSIARIDFLNGPFSAAYPGNSIGGVLLITSKMPDRLVASAKETLSVQPWNQYGTKDTYLTSQTSASVGDRNGKLSWLASANYLDSYQQPLTYTTNGTIPAGTTGAFPALNKQGLPANVVGTGALAHSQQTAMNLRFAYDLTPLVQATYAFGVWNNVQTSNPQTYLRSAATGAPTFAGISSFAGNKYTWDQTHLSSSIGLKSDTRGIYDFDITASTYNYLQDIQASPYTVAATGVGYSQNGKITRNDGTNWQNIDAKGIWRPFGFDGPHELSFGLHGDRYELNNPTYASANWSATPSTGTGQLYSAGYGETRTGALWIQDAWKIIPSLKLTLGGRLESWQALDGVNVNTVANAAGVIASRATINQPGLSATNFSPKASLSFDPNKDWNVTVNFGEAYRYPTVAELYQNVTVGGVATVANPFLAPEQDFTTEINVERRWSDGRIRFTLFDERTNNAIISQTNLVTNPSTGAQVPTTTIGNVAAIRMTGAEVSADKDNVLFQGLQLFGSITYVNSRIVSDPTWAGTNPLTNLPDTVVGKRVPYVPDWRAKFGATYRPNEQWAYTIAARYSGKQYSTLDNTDIVPHVYGAFDNTFVVDMKVHYAATRNFSFDVGIDNVFNAQYFLFHPFPGRTYVMASRYTF